MKFVDSTVGDFLLKALVYPLTILAGLIILSSGIKELAKSGMYEQQARLETIQWQAEDMKAFLREFNIQPQPNPPRLRGINEGKTF